MEALISVFQSFSNSIGLGLDVNMGHIWGLFSVSFILLGSLFTYFNPTLNKPHKTISETPSVETQPVLAQKVSEPAPSGPNWSERMKKGFAHSREQIWGKLENIIVGKALSGEVLEEIEELLYGADIGPTVVTELVEELELQMKKEPLSGEGFKKFLFNFLHHKMEPAHDQTDVKFENYRNTGTKPKTIMVVGVNGAGKTTTIGKLATRLNREGAKVVVGACDTFRAAAVDQLEVWCKRAGATMIRAKEGSNPSGVAYQALETAIKEKADFCILDTAGRLHTADNLMEELKKSKRVLEKLDAGAPDHVFLVIDAITGQNALRQAEEFHKTLGLTGLIFTKCDGSSKAGSAIGIVQKLGVPIYFIGVGETVEDLNTFDLDEYLKTLLAMQGADTATQSLH